MTNTWQEPYHIVIDVENKKCRMVSKLASLGFKHLKVVDVRSIKGGSVRHLMDLGEEHAKKIPKELTPKSSAENKSTVWLESIGCEVCNTILTHNAFLVSGKSMPDNIITYSFMVPTHNAFRAIINDLEKTGHKVTVRKVGKFRQQIDVLTEKQEKIFWIALKSGFFDYPRQIDMTELANKLDISTATLSEIIRRGTRRLLEHYFKQELAYNS
ncbi:MAG: helix-turn-helix domain-containing protein [Nitrososphaerota archaeon]|jgi:predicted DNA binding protein|nr:helix-turn-helix domain-containing protein [Nitrososphaerota archaeon]